MCRGPKARRTEPIAPAPTAAATDRRRSALPTRRGPRRLPAARRRARCSRPVPPARARCRHRRRRHRRDRRTRAAPTSCGSRGTGLAEAVCRHPTPTSMKPSSVLLALLAVAATCPSQAQQGDGTEVSTRISVFKPAKVEADAEPRRRASGALGVPRQCLRLGLEERPHARRWPRKARSTSAGETRATSLMLRDANGDGVADGARAGGRTARALTAWPFAMESCTWSQ